MRWQRRSFPATRTEHRDAVQQPSRKPEPPWRASSSGTTTATMSSFLHCHAAAYPVGYELAQSLGAPLDIVVVRKLGVPGHRELAMGAIAGGGRIILDDDLVPGARGIPEKRIRRAIADELREIVRTARRAAPRPPRAAAAARESHRRSSFDTLPDGRSTMRVVDARSRARIPPGSARRPSRSRCGDVRRASRATSTSPACAAPASVARHPAGRPGRLGDSPTVADVARISRSRRLLVRSACNT